MRKRNIVLLIFFSAAVALVLLLPKPKAAGAAGQAGPPAARSGSVASAAPGPSGAAGSGGPADAAGPGRPLGANAGAPGPAASSPGTAGPGTAGGGRGGRSAGTGVAFAVRTEPVRRGTIQDYIETNGDVVSDSAVKVYPYISGRLVSLKVPLGGRVSKGEVLAEVDPSTPGSSFSLNPVLAPISGTVLSLPAAVGSSVGSGTAVAEIGVLEDVQVEARIPERFVGVLRTGLTASVALEAYPKVTFPASVVRVSPIVDPVSRTKTVRLAFDRPDGRINPGMFARIRLNTLAYPDRLIVREDAVRTDSEGTFVFVVRPDSTVEKRRVARGVAVDGTAEIVSGLAEGETVVVEGAAVLSDGAAVRDIGARKVSP